MEFQIRMFAFNQRRIAESLCFVQAFPMGPQTADRHLVVYGKNKTGLRDFTSEIRDGREQMLDYITNVGNSP